MVVNFQGIWPEEYEINNRISVIHIVQIFSRNLVSRI